MLYQADFNDLKHAGSVDLSFRVHTEINPEEVLLDFWRLLLIVSLEELMHAHNGNYTQLYFEGFKAPLMPDVGDFNKLQF